MGSSLSQWSLPVSRYKAGKRRQSRRRIKKPRKERAALRPCANRTASTWPGQVRLWILSAERKHAPAHRARKPKQRQASKARPTLSASPRAGSTTAPIVRTNERPSMAHGRYPLLRKPRSGSTHRDTRSLNPQDSAPPPAPTAPAAANKSLFSQDSIDALTPRLLKRSIRPVTNRPLIWNINQPLLGDTQHLIFPPSGKRDHPFLHNGLLHSPGHRPCQVAPAGPHSQLTAHQAAAAPAACSGAARWQALHIFCLRRDNFRLVRRMLLISCIS